MSLPDAIVIRECRAGASIVLASDRRILLCNRDGRDMGTVDPAWFERMLTTRRLNARADGSYTLVITDEVVL